MPESCGARTYVGDPSTLVAFPTVFREIPSRTAIDLIDSLGKMQSPYMRAILHHDHPPNHVESLPGMLEMYWRASASTMSMLDAPTSGGEGCKRGHMQVSQGCSTIPPEQAEIAVLWGHPVTNGRSGRTENPIPQAACFT